MTMVSLRERAGGAGTPTKIAPPRRRGRHTPGTKRGREGARAISRGGSRLILLGRRLPGRQTAGWAPKELARSSPTDRRRHDESRADPIGGPHGSAGHRAGDLRDPDDVRGDPAHRVLPATVRG